MQASPRSSGGDFRGDSWVREVTDFWFREIGPAAWFRKDEAFDRALARRFATLHEAVASWPPQAALSSADRALATVLVLDQFPRNMYRGSARAFATDGLALEVARGAVRLGLDRQVDPGRRIFLYLPFEHSEDRADQAEAVRLIAGLGDPEFTRYAEAHRAVIERFGRFPHRNALLERVSTPEEEAFLREPGSSF